MNRLLNLILWPNEHLFFYRPNELRTPIKVSEALEFGIVGINEWAAHATEAPFGGWKQSGLGYECGEEGLQEYLEKKLISIGGL